ncbi:MAG TPA: chemotaxis protein CheX [Planctomycetaceae bacterium]|nr:chemotaxis protein CheX [Planctomycetaceae bacterium]
MSACAPSAPNSSLTAEYVNPIITATRSVFEMMLGCVPTRTGLRLKEPGEHSHDVSAVIGISGRAQGTIVVSLTRESACAVVERMIGEKETEINAVVCDAVGELTNMIAGSAKAQLAKYELSISLPNVIAGHNYVMHSPSDVQSMIMSFNSEIGPFWIEIAFTGF